MNFYLNTEVFHNLKDNVTSDDIKSIFEDLLSLINILNENDSDLIFNVNFLNEEINGKPLYTYLVENFDDDEKKIILRRIDIQCANNSCSDILEDYLNEDIEIDYDNSIDKGSGNSILGTYLACALYNESPIIIIDKLCQEEHYFTNDEMEILDNTNAVTYKIENLKLSEYPKIIKKFKDGTYVQLLPWDEYITYSEVNFDHLKFTKNCKKDFKKNQNLSVKHTRLIREQIEKLNKFVTDNNKETKKCAKVDQWGINATPESPSRFQHFKDSLLKKKNCQDKKESMDWHTKIEYYRLYFTCNHDNKMCFTFFTKKIPNP